MLDVLEGSVSWVRKIASMDKYNAMVVSKAGAAQLDPACTSNTQLQADCQMKWEQNQIQSSFDAADLSTSLHDPEGIPGGQQLTRSLSVLHPPSFDACATP